MPNIEVYAFKKPKKIRDRVWEIIETKFKGKLDDVVITTIRSTVRSRKSNYRPFIRVISNDRRIATTLNKILKLDVEWIRLDGFFEGKKKKA